MGMRFRKSVRIAKGVKVNFSKSGASLSLGGRGHSVNIGGRGIRSTVGIPGTGLSYSTTTGGNSAHRKSTSNSSSPRLPVQLPKEIGIKMNERGQIVVLDSSGQEITDKAVLRKIKSLPVFKSQIEVMEEQRKEKIDELVQKSAAENERFIDIYKLSPAVDSLRIFNSRLISLQASDSTREYDIPAPSENEIRSTLAKEAEESIKGLFFKVGKLRKQYVEDNFEQRYSSAYRAWEEKKAEAEKAALDEREQQKAFLQALIDGNDDAVCEIFDSWIESCELPVEISIDYDWNSETGMMMLDVNLPKIENISTTRLIKTESGNIREKKKTQTELRGEYAKLVLGLAIFISSNAFNISPAITKILISGYTQREDNMGMINDDYIYSIKFTRDMFESIELSSVNPKAFCFDTEHRCNMTSTALFKAITPFDEY